MNHLLKKKKNREDVSGYACYCLCGVTCDLGCEGCSTHCGGFCHSILFT